MARRWTERVCDPRNRITWGWLNININKVMLEKHRIAHWNDDWESSLEKEFKKRNHEMSQYVWFSFSFSHFLYVHFWWVCILLRFPWQAGFLSFCIYLRICLAHNHLPFTIPVTLRGWLVATIPILNIRERIDWSSFVPSPCHLPWRVGWGWNIKYK